MIATLFTSNISKNYLMLDKYVIYIGNHLYCDVRVVKGMITSSTRPSIHCKTPVKKMKVEAILTPALHVFSREIGR